MWFRDIELSGRSLRGGELKFGRQPSWKMHSRLNMRRGTGGARTAVFVLVPIILVAGGALLWWGARWAGRRLYSENDRFAIRCLEITGGPVITAELIREYTGIREGMNLFKVDIGKIRAKFLERAPNVRAMRISRYLPGTLRIEVAERHPLARIGRRGSLVADRDGYVFGIRSGLRALPSIEGYRDAHLKPGSRLRGAALAALEVLAMCDNPKLGLRVRAVEVDRDEYLVVSVSVGRPVTRVQLAWPGMGQGTRESQAHLLARLKGIRETLVSEEGRGLSELDATFGDRIYGR